VIRIERDQAGVTGVAFTPEPRELQVLRSPRPVYGPQLSLAEEVLAAQDRYCELVTDLSASRDDVRRATSGAELEVATLRGFWQTHATRPGPSLSASRKRRCHEARDHDGDR
jgi:hypothetical protein